MKKVAVLMSGGIDSSVAAALLKRAGFELVGIFMKVANLSFFKESEKRAKRIAKILKIPFYSFNLKKEFKKKIIENFLTDYKKGITPNPCVICNKEIKLGILLKKALKLGTDYVATGHYARKIQNSKCKNQNDKSKCKIFKLLRARDKEKDQSYFLWMLNQNQLRKIFFPIGNYTHNEVEKLARKFKLPVLKVKKSVEICFVQTTINDFLKKYLKEKPGKIIDTEGKILGEHRGLWFYTIGQRKGIKLPQGPYYVLDKDLKKNILIVTKNKRDLLKKEIIAKNVNWISGKIPKLPLKIKAKVRYRHQPTTATITKILNSKFCILKFNKFQHAITPGQSVVFYKKNEVLGGGIIT